MAFQTATGQDLRLAADWLRRSELVAIPTETVYGLAGNALDDRAIVKIFETKERPLYNPLIIHVGHPDQINDLIVSPDATFDL
ncbi:MAG TPA: Sua5/YciO/YrdC/YwlC family protein, partial [Saprospiraceae bacterium]|nr:Sua5/YciO/YrdC/YwlC family protein [Saprospiraceae bacterium]